MRKIFAIFTILAIFAGCAGGGRDETLVGAWMWETDAAYSLVFHYDGVGERGFCETWNTFVWETRGNRLNINRARTGRNEITEERWDFEIYDDRLTVVNANLPEHEVIYTYLPLIEGQNPELVGEWSWEYADAFIYLFHDNGRGTRGFPGEDDNFHWAADESHLLIVRDNAQPGEIRGELWSFELDDQTLTVTSLQEDDSVFTYTRN